MMKLEVIGKMVGEQKPMVTRAEYDAARAVLDALPPGIYMKCSGCTGWYRGGSFTMLSDGGVLCGRCSQ